MGIELIFELRLFLGVILYVGLVVYGLTEIPHRKRKNEWDL